ncbi:Methyltransferase domain-containing protein [Oribacterium sp. KHPX15]|uniref:class I SAM-dependent methyltransferase n=1 Tax=Oribacterium sp. KHPX15 TaxID=1855342 RepID=UPI0008987D3C|nr:class I SAM-dependent methyltransferase [Oribacterium sp. KHPX15]SEA48442.1 Methyltransferase domain-containing protein [Oribacterium sp. KHPX15]
MSKYNFEMDLSQQTSTGMIVQKLKHGMNVLEFGCAHGRMTRYMKEVLDCAVYIVEYDIEAYESAIKYAKDGVCGDIQKYEWVTKFKDIRFDAILFADVLEHLTEPVKVLKIAGNMLAEDGKVFISIPNITHNDIILKSYMDRFDYTDIGLLDNTHVHFWGLENLEDFARDSDLYLKTVEATYTETGLTEQFRGKELKSSLLLLNILNERKAGQVYQFIITMQKSPVDVSDDKYHLKKPYVYSHIYLDRGEGFNERDIIPVKALFSKNGAYYVNYRIDDTINLRCIRFDPVELQGCYLKYLHVRQGTKELSPQFSDSVDIGEEVLIKGNDPQVTITLDGSGEPVSIDSEFILLGEEYINSTERGISELAKQVNEYVSQLNEREKIINDLETRFNKSEEEYRNCINNLERQISDNLSKYNKEMNDISHAYEQEKKIIQDAAEEESMKLRKQLDEKIILLGSYQALADSKDTYIVELDRIIDQRNARIKELDQAVEHYRKYPGIRLVRFIGRILRGIKRRIVGR